MWTEDSRPENDLSKKETTSSVHPYLGLFSLVSGWISHEPKKKNVGLGLGIVASHHILLSIEIYLSFPSFCYMGKSL